MAMSSLALTPAVIVIGSRTPVVSVRVMLFAKNGVTTPFAEV
jgi:hypothetical protein